MSYTYTHLLYCIKDSVSEMSNIHLAITRTLSTTLNCELRLRRRRRCEQTIHTNTHSVTRRRRCHSHYQFVHGGVTPPNIRVCVECSVYAAAHILLHRHNIHTHKNTQTNIYNIRRELTHTHTLFIVVLVLRLIIMYLFFQFP